MAKKEEQKKVTKLDEKVEGLRIFINTKYQALVLLNCSKVQDPQKPSIII